MKEGYMHIDTLNIFLQKFWETMRMGDEFGGREGRE